MANVRATNGSEIRYFNETVWNKMPADHYGWKATAEVPESVQDLRNQLQNKLSEINTGTDPQGPDLKIGPGTDPNPDPVVKTVNLDGQGDQKIFPDIKGQDDPKGQDPVKPLGPELGAGAKDLGTNPNPQAKTGKGANSRK